MTPSAVEPAMFWPVAQCLKHLRQFENFSKYSSLNPEVEETSDFARNARQTVLKQNLISYRIEIVW